MFRSVHSWRRADRSAEKKIFQEQCQQLEAANELEVCLYPCDL